MVSVHSTYNHPDHPHAHAHQYVKKRRKEPRNVDQKVDYPDVKNRTSWASASLARSLIREGKASGNETSLWIRAKLQAELFKLGSKIQRHAGKILLIGVLILGSLAFFNKNAHFETRVEKLWVEAGGRLEKELEYVEASLGIGAGATNELIIQTPNQGFSSVLTPDALLTHLEVLKTASKVMVERNDVTWQLKDLCYAPTIPKTEIHVIDQILEKLFPCAIITPLDCFWEGAKLLGPDYPVHIPLGEGEGSMPVSWTTLNPQHLIQQMKSFNFQFDAFEDFMKTAGIKSGYQEKPCLNPHDPDCPPTAPNKESRKVPDIGAELTGGCYGFASRYMHWPEQLVVGGTIKNKTGHITRAKGLQSSIQLMGEKDLYDFWSNTHKVHYGMEWNREVASSILSEWQAKFSQEVATLVKEKQMHKKYQINAFSSSYLNDILATFSEYDVFSLSLSYLFVVIYAGLTLFQWNDKVKSQSGLGLSGVLLVTLTVAGGLGCCALIDIPFNAITTQVIPVWVVCMGINPIFVMTQTYAEICNSNIPMEHKVGEVVKRTGVLVLYPAICITAAFVSAALIPIPAIRGPMLSGGLLIGFNGLSMLLLFPALLSLDLKRRSAERLDVLCCYSSKVPEGQKGQNKWTLKYFVIYYWSLWLVRTPMKIATLMLAFILTSCGLYGLVHMQQGLDMQEVVPQNTSAYDFVKAQNSYFGFYNMYAVTKGNFEYPQNQAILYDYHNAFVRVPNIIKDDDGGLEEFWLPLFRNWLLRLQNAFDDDFSQGNIYEYGWHQNASSDAILAYKLMVQTGHVDYPIDETLLLRNRLVDSHGMINPSAFYNYLSAWASNDAMTYGFSQVSIVPEPKHWHHDSRDAGLIIPKSMPITFARIPFHLYNLGSTSVMLQMIEDVRNVCNRFEDRGLPNFPTGVPFTFWEQYINLPFWLLVAFAAILAAVFLLTSFLLWSFWVGVITVVVIGSIVVQLYGVMEFLGVTLSAVPAVITILAVGLGVEFTMHIILGFITSIGNRNRRLMISLEHMFAPVFHGAVSTFLGIIMLAFSHFDFVVRYFFMVFTGLILLGVFNGLVFLPVLLLMVGPPAEVVPKDGGDEVDLSTTEVIRGGQNRRSSMRSNPLQNTKPPSQNNLQNLKINAGSLPKRHCHHSDASLSTIAEESGSYVSQHDNASINALPLTSQSLNGASVKIEPEITVETTTHPLGNSLSSSRCSTPTAQVTKVTANLAFKVEVHAPHVSSPQVAEPPTRPVSSASRRSSRSSSRSSSKVSEASATGNSSVHSSLSDSLRSSLSSTSGQDYDNNGDAGFSEK